jgi:hypothetical protein
MIQAYVQENHRHWDVHLQKFAFALRTAVNETTKVTPALLNLGRQLPLPFDRNLQMNSDINHKEIIETLSTLPEQLKELINWVRDNIIQAHNINKKYYDQKHRHIEYVEGELVLIKDTTLSNKDSGVMKKCANRWTGPVTISKKISDLTYEIQNATTKKHMGKRHVSDIKPYFQREPNIVPDPPTSQSQFQVQKRSLRPTKRINYRTLAGYRQNESTKP